MSDPIDLVINLNASTNDLNQHQASCLRTAQYPNVGRNYIYPTLGLLGEAGEIANKLKKVQRDSAGVLTQEHKEALKAELGDVLWYVSVLAFELGYSLAGVAAANLAKLADRAARGTISGSGDNR